MACREVWGFKHGSDSKSISEGNSEAWVENGLARDKQFRILLQ